MTLNKNKLNCMNYLITFNIETNDNFGIWYGQDGLRSLYKNAKFYNEDFKAIVIAMNAERDENGYAPQYVGHTINITMI